MLPDIGEVAFRTIRPVCPISTLPSGHRADYSRCGAFCCGRLIAVGGLVGVVGP